MAGLALGVLVLAASADGPPALIWTHTYDVAAGNAIGRGVAIDSNGNVITAGYVAETLSGNPATGTNGFLRKRRYDGVVAWTVTVDNPNTDTVASNSLDDLRGVCVDAADNVVAVGTWSGDWGTPSIGYWETVLVQKYTSGGALAWEWKGGSGYGPWSTMEGVAADAAGNVIAVGKTVAGPYSGSDWGIWKLSPGGTVQPGFPISTSFSTGQYLNDVAYAVAAHTDGSFVVAGVIGVSDGPDASRRDHDWHVRRYDADGTLAWQDTWSGTAHLADYALGVTLDAAGNAYVAGYTNRGTTNSSPDFEYDGLLIKYSPTGTRLWTVGSTGDAGASVLYTGVALLGQDELSIVGYARDAGSDEYVGISEGRKASDGSLLGDERQEYAGGDVLPMATVAHGRLLAGTGYFGTSGAYQIFTSLAEAQNRAPVIDEPPAATTDLGAIGEDVAFTVAAHDPDGDPLGVTWDFGDGGSASGPDATHAFTTPGAHMVTVTVSDGIEHVVDVVDFTVGVPVEAPSVKAQLNFKKPGKDQVQVKCRLDLTDQLLIEGETVTLDVGGVDATFTLDKKGKGKSDAGWVKLKYLKKTRVWQLTAKLGKSDFADAWADEGLVDETQKKTPVTVKVTVELGAGVQCAHMVDALYTAKAGKWGKSK